ncbi:LPS O-antigen chain length determinant protein WzzB [Vibrio litoralis]|uniref:LPS O-antigen chain length determinant protein WzzB n=1 Tax=Vibrio litoralis TaxID=335972 RepID=UPI000405ACC1|nr:Wzz/FepE/Etk N-terminal domain-containing protein [Vibrio litoralis]
MSQPPSPSHHAAQQPQMPPQYYYPQPQDDEIDLRELFAALWKGKWIIIACTFVCTALAIVYALMAKEQWSSTAKIAEPQVSDYSEYQNQVVLFQPIFDVYQEDGTVLVSKALDGLTDARKLYDLFIDEFNSSSNKKAFLETSAIFKKDKADLDNPEDEGALRKLYSDWYKFLSIKPEDAKRVDGPYVITVSAETSQDSFELLNNYIAFVDTKVHQKALNNLAATISSKKNELKQQSIMLTKQAEQRLLVEKERSEYALNIAQAAGVNKPLQNFGDKEIFAINLGSDALTAKVNALSKVKNLSVIEPRLEQLSSKLEQIDQLEINKDVKFSAYRYLDQPERSVSKDKPRRIIIVLIGLILGGFISALFIIIRFIFLREENV